MTEEFVLDGTDVDEDALAELDVEPIFSYGEKQSFRFRRSPDETCPCDQIEGFGCPVVDVRSRKGKLVVAFHAETVEDIERVLTDLRERYPKTAIRRLVTSDGEDGIDNESVLVNKGALTERQWEVLRKAYEMGYFDHPKGANAGEVSEELGIVRSTFAEHIAVAQKKIISSIVDE